MSGEVWIQREAEDFKVGDTIENPANGAGETVTAHRVQGSFVFITWTGWHERMVQRGEQFWGLKRDAS